MKYIFYILSIILLKIVVSFGQDPQLTQYYSAPCYLAPSYAGGTKGTRVVMNFRSEWPQISSGYTTFATSIDHYFPQHRSGVALFFLRDIAGTSRLSNTNIGIQYSYAIRMSKHFYIRPGIQFLKNQRSIDYNNLLFGDQITLNGVAPESTETNGALMEKNGYMDFAVSVIFYNEKYWGGMAVDHLNKPDQSLMQKISIVPVKYSLYGGSKFISNERKNEEEQSITGSFLYKSQGKYDQLDLGGYFQRFPLTFGIWFRGIPVFKHYAPGYGNYDALNFIVGYTINDIKFGYSYDFTISRLASNTGGSHEVSLQYVFNQDQKPRKKKGEIIPCPSY